MRLSAKHLRTLASLLDDDLMRAAAAHLDGDGIGHSAVPRGFGCFAGQRSVWTMDDGLERIA
jgi:hypothetical protein